MNYWLLKSEPGDYGIQDLERDQTTNWDGVRNYQARNFLKQMKVGDLAFIYHSIKERSIVGIGKCVGEYFTDPTDETAQFVATKIQFVKKLRNPVSLDSLKSEKLMQDLLLLKQSRLSVMPFNQKQWDRVIEMSEKYI